MHGIKLPLQSISVYAVCPNCILSFPQFLFTDAVPFVFIFSPPLPGPVVSLYSHNYATHIPVRAITRLYWGNLLTNICPMTICRSGILFNHPVNCGTLPASSYAQWSFVKWSTGWPFFSQVPQSGEKSKTPALVLMSQVVTCVHPNHKLMSSKSPPLSVCTWNPLHPEPPTQSHVPWQPAGKVNGST